MRAFAIKVECPAACPASCARVTGSMSTGPAASNGSIGGDRGEVTKLIEAGVKLIAIDQSASGDLDEATSSPAP